MPPKSDQRGQNEAARRARAKEKRQKREFDLTFIFPRELRILLERNGLQIEKLYGDYDGSKLTSNSPRMIACCKIR